MPRIPHLHTNLAPAVTVFQDYLVIAARKSDGDGILLASSNNPDDERSWQLTDLDDLHLPAPGPEQIRTSHAPSLGVASNRLYLAFKGHNNQHIWAISRGATGRWEGHGSVGGAATAGAPALAGDQVFYRGGEDTQLWQAPLRGGHVPFAIEHCHSPGGPAATVYRTTYGDENEFPVIAFRSRVDNNGRSQVVSSRYRISRRYQMTSNGTGVTRETIGWDAPTQLFETAESPEPPALTMHKDFMAAAWRHQRDFSVSIATDDNGWARRALREDCTNVSPALASLGGHLYLVYKKHDSTEVWFTIIPDHTLRDGVDFLNIPWAQTAAQSRERLRDRQLAVIRHWSARDVFPWVTDRLDDNTGWSRSTSSLMVCTACLWRAANDTTLSTAQRDSFTQVASDYLTSRGSYRTWPALEPSPIGTCEEALRELNISNGADYDFRLRLLIRMACLFHNSPVLDDRAKRKVIGDLLTVDGNDHHTHLITRDEMVERLVRACHEPSIYNEILDSELDHASVAVAFMNVIFPFLGDMIAGSMIRDQIRGDLHETENHVLMSETTRYLTNQLIASGEVRDFTSRDPSAGKYDNQHNHFRTWMVRWLCKFMAKGFEEYNSTTYSGLSMSALFNLYDFCNDDRVRLAARILLDFTSACFALQSFDLKRCVGFCRKPVHRLRHDLWLDPLAGIYAVLIGNYAGLNEEFDGRWDFQRDSMFFAATTEYRVPDLILHLAIDKGSNPYEMHINHVHTHSGTAPVGSTRYPQPYSPNIEIISARRGYVLSAGGHYSRASHWWRDFIPGDEGAEEHDGWARPTALIIRGSQRVNEPDFGTEERPYYGDYLIHSWGNADHPQEQNNTGVTGNVAVSCGPFHIPYRYNGRLTPGRNSWGFLPLPDSGLIVAINQRWNILEVVDDERHGGVTLSALRQSSERQCAGAPPEGTRRYTTHDGKTLEFDPSKPPGTWPITRIGDRAQAGDYHAWPVIDCLEGEGLNRVIWADGFGRVVINNPALGQSLILSLVDWDHPVRLEQGCVARDLVQDARAVTASSNADTAGSVRDNDMSTGWTSAGITNEWIAIDFGRTETFNFVSIRFAQRGEALRPSVRLETSDNGSRWSEAATRSACPGQFDGIDFEAGPTTARHVRLVFNGPSWGSPTLSIHKVEIYRYQRP